MGKTCNITMYDDIGDPWGWGDGTSAKYIKSILDSMGEVDSVEIDLNSPGGIASEGIAIYNLLKNCGKPVNIRVIGIAASAASIVAMAATRLEVAEGSFLMIHRAASGIWGNAEDMKSEMVMLEKFDQEMANIYARRADCDPGVMMELMRAETWMTGQEAVNMKLADACCPMEENTKAKASANGRRFVFNYHHVPESLKELFTGPVNKSQAGDPHRKEGNETMETKATEVTATQQPTAGTGKETEQPVANTPVDVNAVASKAAQDAIASERKRASEIMAKAREFDLVEMGEKLVADGTEVQAALGQLKDKRLADITASASTSPGANPDANAQNEGEKAAWAKALENVKARTGRV